MSKEQGKVKTKNIGNMKKKKKEKERNSDNSGIKPSTNAYMPSVLKEPLATGTQPVDLSEGKFLIYVG